MPIAPTITGARGTLGINQTNRRPDIKDRVMELQPDTTPFVVLLNRAASAPSINPQFQWFENDLEPRFDTTSGTQLAGDTTINVAHGTYFAQHDLVYVPRTGETFRVTAVATNALTVVRGVGSTAAAMNSGEELLITGSAQPEGDTSKPARSGNTVTKTNYCQIFREPFELTGTLLSSETFVTDTEYQRQAQLKAIEHRKEIEYGFLVNHPSEDTSGSQPRRTTGGARHFITSNVTDVGGTMTEAEFWAALRPVFRYGSTEKLLLSGGLPVSVVNQYPQNKILVQQGESTYGLKVTQYDSPFGTANLVVDYLLEGTTLGGEMFILDMANIRYRYLAGNGVSRDTHLRTDIQAPDADTRKAEYLSECGVEFGLEQSHGRITNVTG